MRERTRPIVKQQYQPNGMMTIREARKAKGMVQWDLARLVGLPQVLISYIEMGIVNVPRRDRPKWEWALDAHGRIQWPE